MSNFAKFDVTFAKNGRNYVSLTKEMLTLQYQN